MQSRSTRPRWTSYGNQPLAQEMLRSRSLSLASYLVSRLESPPNRVLDSRSSREHRSVDGSVAHRNILSRVRKGSFVSLLPVFALMSYLGAAGRGHSHKQIRRCSSSLPYCSTYLPGRILRRSYGTGHKQMISFWGQPTASLPDRTMVMNKLRRSNTPCGNNPGWR